MKISIVLFALTYILMLRFEKVRPFIALGAAAVYLLSGMLPFEKSLGYVHTTTWFKSIVTYRHFISFK